MWPNRRPFRRAAAYDGVFPMAEDMHPLRPAEVGEIVEYVRRHRADDGPFDVTIGGPPLSPGELEEYRAAGVTWYQVGPDPRGESPEETRGWIAAGPPSRSSVDGNAHILIVSSAARSSLPVSVRPG